MKWNIPARSRELQKRDTEINVQKYKATICEPSHEIHA